jgi:UDP-N-acetylmuramyl pentapeptide phosphotransferase/UDP-N-acetylglucosamine-1-phosphate transferase
MKATKTLKKTRTERTHYARKPLMHRETAEMPRVAGLAITSSLLLVSYLAPAGIGDDVMSYDHVVS